MNVLAIDTSNQELGIAILGNDRIIGEYITNLKKNHSVRVMPAIDQLMKDCEMQPTDLDKIVVAKGPGSYTGVRIGVTIAKSLAWSLHIPLVGVSSLAILAAGAGRYFNGYVSPLFDARRNNVYTGLYRYRDGQLVTMKEDRNILITEWLAELKQYAGKILFIGNDTQHFEESIKETLGDEALIAAISEHNPRPSELGLLGNSFSHNELHSFVPNYIRLVEAEANWLKKQKQGKV